MHLEKTSVLLYDVRQSEPVTGSSAPWELFQKVIVNSSPDPQQTQFLSKQLLPATFYVSTWSPEDLMAIAPFMAVPVPTVEERVRAIGGLPRYVFADEARPRGNHHALN